MKVLKVVGVILLALVLVAVSGIFYFKASAKQRLDKDYRLSLSPVPIPYPLSSAELANLPEDRRDAAALQAVALERALARGKHYLESRAGCGDCHGSDF